MSELLGFLRSIFTGLYDLFVGTSDTKVIYAVVAPILVCTGLVIFCDFIFPALASLTSLNGVGYHIIYYDKIYAKFGKSPLFKKINRRLSYYKFDDKFLAEVTEFTDLADPRTFIKFYQKKLDRIHNEGFDGSHNKKFQEFIDKYAQISATGDYKQLTTFAISHPINFAFFKVFNSSFKNQVVNAQVRESYRQEFRDVYGITPTEQMLSEYINRRGRKSYRGRVNAFKTHYFG